MTKLGKNVKLKTTRTLEKYESDDRCPGRVNSSCCGHAPAVQSQAKLYIQFATLVKIEKLSKDS